jgi:DNA (cytosine-5)-methyltransferase 1
VEEVGKMEIIGVDFFSGIGGASKGFQKAGINIVRGLDNDSTCEVTYNKNCAPASFYLADVNKVDPKKVLPNNKKMSSSDRLVFVACAPCQPFSRSNKNKTVQDKRKRLILRFFDFVKELRPDAIFIENVPGFEQAEGGSFLSLLGGQKLGYSISFKRINAKYYGIPQNRSRFIILASRHGKIEFPSYTHGKKLLPFATVEDKIAKYPAIEPGKNNSEIPNHVARSVSDLNILRLINTPLDGGSRTDWPENLWLDCHKGKHTGHSDVYGRMMWKKPSPTLTCKCNSISNGRFGHPTQNRAISLREAAALQTFPDDFIFYGSQTDIARHIGNAVPPLLAEILGKQIRDHLLSTT